MGIQLARFNRRGHRCSLAIFDRKEIAHLSAIKIGRERKGPPGIIQKCRLRNWPVLSADFPMTPMEGTEHHFGPFSEQDFGAISGGPLFSRPLWFTAESWSLKKIARFCGGAVKIAAATAANRAILGARNLRQGIGVRVKGVTGSDAIIAQ